MKNENDELIKYQEEALKKNKVIAQARAIIQRAQNAKIPNKHIGINEDEFKNLLSSSYKDNQIEKILFLTYKNPKEIFKRNFIVISGGSSLNRKLAGFGLLFRAIACDTYGLYEPFNSLIHNLQIKNNFNRIPYCENIKKQDVLFLSEFDSLLLSDKDDVGTFIDEILEYREDNSLPTILSFIDSIGEKSNPINNRIFGSYLLSLTKENNFIINNKKTILNIKVNV